MRSIVIIAIAAAVLLSANHIKPQFVMRPSGPLPPVNVP